MGFPSAGPDFPLLSAFGGSAAFRPRFFSFFVSFFSFVVLLLFSFPFASAQPSPGAPVVTGASRFSSERIRSVIGTARADSAAALLRRAYADDGFLDVEAALRGDTIRVTEGDRYRVRRAEILPDSLRRIIPDLFEDVRDFVGEYFSGQEAAAFMRECVLELNRRGYALASARIAFAAVNRDSATLALAVHVVPGDAVVIDEVRIEGGEGTSRELILKRINLPDSALFTDELVRDVRERLTRLQIFSEVAEPQIYVTDSGGYGMLIRVKEGGRNTFDGVVGYQPATELEENGYFTGLVRIVLRNLFGAGERIAGRWERRSRTTSELELGYGQPFIFGLPVDVEAGFRQIEEGETTALTGYVQRFLKLDAYYAITDNWSVRLGGSLESTIPGPDTLAGPCSPRRLLNSSTLGSTLGVRFDTRSNPINPSGGIFYSTSYTFGSKSLNDPDQCLPDTLPLSESRRLLQADVESYIRVAGPLVLAGIANFSEVRGGNLEESELWRFGGSANVRGYRDGLIRASRIAWGRAEARVLLSTVSHASIFFDGGYYFREADARRGLEETEDGIYGYGVGLQVDTPVGIARFSFALGRGDTFDEGKVSVGLVGEF